MTRAHFETTFCELYEAMVRYLTQRHGMELAQDLVHQTLMNILAHKTYRRGPKQHAKRWIYYKISREEARYKQKQRYRAHVQEDSEWLQQQSEKGMI